ncbi:hypothetical protein CRYUN_Cryun04dG0177900 [Craigia yunnanensis]
MRGELMIAKLENLKNVTSECKEANLKGKQHLEVLTLEWSREVNNHIFFEEDEALLEGLQPHSNLQESHFYGYRAEMLPNWMLFDMRLLLPNLLEITIWSYSGAESSSSLSFGGNLLKGGTGGKEFFPCLKESMLFDLKGWWREDPAVADDNCGKAAASPLRLFQQKEPTPSFPCLSKLTIGICTSLTYMPLHPLLEEQQIKNVMHIDGNIDLVSFPEKGLHHLTSLHHLSIENCPKLVFLPEEGLKCLTSLRFFYIRGCEMLKSRSKGFRHLKALEELEIKECRELDLSKDVEENVMELQCLKSLRTMKLGDIPKLSSLPDALQHVTTLKYLPISSCSNLKIYRNGFAI